MLASSHSILCSPGPQMRLIRGSTGLSVPVSSIIGENQPQAVVANLRGQPERIYSHLRERPLGLCDEVGRGRHGECGQHHPAVWSLTEKKGESVWAASIPSFLLLDCGHSVTTPPRPTIPPFFPVMDLCPLKLILKKPFFLKSLLIFMCMCFSLCAFQSLALSRCSPRRQ